MLATILGNAKLIGAALGAAAMLFVGYTFGARKVDSLEAQIAQIRRESDFAAMKLKDSQDEIMKQLKQREAEYARETERLKTVSEQKARELSAALSGANARIASLKAEVSVVDARRAKLLADMEKASAAERTRLQGQIDAIDKERRVLVAKVDANQCLGLSVPEQVIGPVMVSK